MVRLEYEPESPLDGRKKKIEAQKGFSLGCGIQKRLKLIAYRKALYFCEIYFRKYLSKYIKKCGKVGRKHGNHAVVAFIQRNGADLEEILVQSLCSKEVRQQQMYLFSDNNKDYLTNLTNGIVDELTDIVVRLDHKRVAGALHRADTEPSAFDDALRKLDAKSKRNLSKDSSTMNGGENVSKSSVAGDLFPAAPAAVGDDCECECDSELVEIKINDKKVKTAGILKPGREYLDYDAKRALVEHIVVYAFRLRKELNTATSVAKTKVQEYWADRIPPLVVTLGVVLVGKVYLDILDIQNASTTHTKVNKIISNILTILTFISAFYMVYLRLPHAVDGATKQKASDWYQSQKDPLGKFVMELSPGCGYHKEQVEACFKGTSEHVLAIVAHRFSNDQYVGFHESSMRNHAVTENVFSIPLVQRPPSVLSSSQSTASENSKNEEEREKRRAARDALILLEMEALNLKDNEFDGESNMEIEQGAPKQEVSTENNDVSILSPQRSARSIKNEPVQEDPLHIV